MEDELAEKPVLTFKDRLANEKSELDEKLSKLSAFISSEKFATVDAIQQSLLKVQEFAMKAYSQCLEERISYLNMTTTTS